MSDAELKRLAELVRAVVREEIRGILPGQDLAASASQEDRCREEIESMDRTETGVAGESSTSRKARELRRRARAKRKPAASSPTSKRSSNGER